MSALFMKISVSRHKRERYDLKMKFEKSLAKNIRSYNSWGATFPHKENTELRKVISYIPVPSTRKKDGRLQTILIGH